VGKQHANRVMLKGHVGQYVFISTISVYAANDKPADETAPLVTYDGDDPMAETIKSLSGNQRLYGPMPTSLATGCCRSSIIR
jgi:2'-hydroxyisoflavone reductase